MGYHKVNGEWIKKIHTAEATQKESTSPSAPATAAPSGPSLGDVMTALDQLQMQIHQHLDLVDQRFHKFQAQMNLMESKLNAYSF